LSDAVGGAITSVHRYDLPVSPAAVWELISDVGAYRSWWSWLRVFDAGGLESGEEWRCVVQPPLPYLVRFGVVIERADPPHLVQARVTGDVVGTATLALHENESGCTATLSSTLAPGNPLLRMMSRLAAPMARFGHDWVLDSGARQFIARAVTPTAST
jgi:uncharacterized protein YndB with AHSA1/START domain